MSPVPQQRIDAVRRFSRFYTSRLGILNEGLLDSPYSLTEARILYEIGHRGTTTASEMAQELRLDTGYLSRILKRFAARGLIERTPCAEDARRTVLSLTRRGRAELARLETRSSGQVGALLGKLGAARQEQLVRAMVAIEDLLDEKHTDRPAYTLRPHRPGDMGWIVQAHGTFYAREYGWDASFEALVAQIVARLIEDFDPERDCCWIAETDGKTIGSIALVKETDEIARLRLLIVEPEARGLGIGKALVEECVRFARNAGYRSIVLWTHEVLTAARQLYSQAGFELVDSEPTHAFGVDHISETWRLDLDQSPQ